MRRVTQAVSRRAPLGIGRLKQDVSGQNRYTDPMNVNIIPCLACPTRIMSRNYVASGGSLVPPLILDGSISTELDPSLNIHLPGAPRASLQALMHHPDRIGEIHQTYITAGAHVVTTANFSVVPQFLGEHESRMAELTELSGKLAYQARQKVCTLVPGPPHLESSQSSSTSSSSTSSPSSSSSLFSPSYMFSRNTALASIPRSDKEYYYNGNRILIAGCIPPIVDPNLELARTDDKDKRDRCLLEAVVTKLDPYVDLYLCESLSTIPQALLAARVAMTSNKPVWVSWKLQDNVRGMPRLFSGETIPQAVDSLLTHLPRFVDAYLFNCSTPDSISSALPQLRQVTSRPIGAFARLSSLDVTGKAVTMSPEEYAKVAARWVEVYGVNIVGGCCGIGANHIRALAKRLNPTVCDLNAGTRKVFVHRRSSPRKEVKESYIKKSNEGNEGNMEGLSGLAGADKATPLLDADEKVKLRMLRAIEAKIAARKKAEEELAHDKSNRATAKTTT